MTKPKLIVWHKKQAKMVSSKMLKPHVDLVVKKSENNAIVNEPMKRFVKNFDSQIKAAAKS